MADKKPCPAQGASAKYAVVAGEGDQTASYDSFAERYVFQNFGLRPNRQLDVESGSIGERMRHVSQASQTTIALEGRVTMRCTPNNMRSWLPRILGDSAVVAAPDGTVFTPDGTVPRFMVIADTGPKVFQYLDVQVARAAFVGSSGQSLSLEMDWIARSYSEISAPSSYPNIGTADADQSFTFANGELIRGSDNYCFDQFRLTIDNGLSARYYNSETPKCVAEGIRTTSLAFGQPWNSDTATDWWNQGDAGVVASLKFNRSPNMSMLFDLAAVKWPDEGPQVNGDGDIDYGINAQIFATDSATDIKATLDCNSAA